MIANRQKSGPFRTIGDVSSELGLPTHILRYWETRFTQLRPLTRAGNRRYYRPEDVELAHRINHLLNVEGYTIKGARKALSDGVDEPFDLVDAVQETSGVGAEQLSALISIRKRLSDALSRS